LRTSTNKHQRCWSQIYLLFPFWTYRRAEMYEEWPRTC